MIAKATEKPRDQEVLLRYFQQTAAQYAGRFGLGPPSGLTEDAAQEDHIPIPPEWKFDLEDEDDDDLIVASPADTDKNDEPADPPDTDVPDTEVPDTDLPDTEVSLSEKPKKPPVLLKRRPAKTTAKTKKDEEVPLDPIAHLQGLVARAKNGDAAALEEIRRHLDANPALWQTIGNMAAHAEMLLIDVIAAGNPLVAESTQREIARLKIELAEGSSPSPLERLTIQRVTACWLHTQYVDRMALAADTAGSTSALWGKRQEMTERRYQIAIKSLELARRLNVGRQVPVVSDVRATNASFQHQSPPPGAERGDVDAAPLETGNSPSCSSTPNCPPGTSPPMAPRVKTVDRPVPPAPQEDGQHASDGVEVRGAAPRPPILRKAYAGPAANALLLSSDTPELDPVVTPTGPPKASPRPAAGRTGETRMPKVLGLLRTGGALRRQQSAVPAGVNGVVAASNHRPEFG